MTEQNVFEKCRNFHLLEKHRMDSFKQWPFDEEAPCSVSKMAEAGFYWSGSSSDPDTVTCFLCTKSLDGWEPTDDPWKEHAKHAPQCLFVQYGRKESDLLLEEFLKIYKTVLKNKFTADINGFKKSFSSAAADELSNYIENKK
ncbi:baculoviral IAP repeat-containing protein 5-like [Teleopsis dalmanni]|uniref:baculoviral IAP repeat-containing protein 5-like n=1 Tax=Teleopsis dalmanni TaxID=139649 RepID=UPI0018CD253F|nr:baculoviral IAP repeat-containing protein 5-like [Teleopsis dalmanni]